MKKIFLCFCVFLMMFLIKSNLSSHVISLELDQICLKEFINCLSYSNEYLNREQFEVRINKKINYYFISLDNLTLENIEFSYGKTFCQIKVLYQYYFFSKKIIKEVGVNERKDINAYCYCNYDIT